MKKKSTLIKLGAIAAVFTLNVSFISFNNKTQKVDAYDAASLPTTIDLNDCGEQEIRTYYSGLNSLSASERQGTNLLKNLKPILSNNQKYYSYENGESIWKFYEITDRDWVKSPASAITNGSYDANTNIITGYKYGSSNSNPYLHALYINRNVNNQTKAWGDHTQTNWGINREHIWAKSHGFQAEGAGGARGDPMHLWAANGYANNKHSNYFFAFVDKNRSYDDCGSEYSYISNNLKGYSKNAGGNQTVFEPQDSDKGDIARAVFYMVARYNNYANASSGFGTDNPNLVLVNSLSENSRTGTSSAYDPYGMGLMSDLLAWNKLDPVDEYEIHRNNLLYKNYTNNRNPFIDFPNWADAIWGTANLDGTNYNSNITTSASPATDPINAIESNRFGISTHNLELQVGETAEIYATNASSNISWSISNGTVASLNKISTSNNEKVTITALSGGTATITATSGSDSATCTITVGETTNYGTAENPLSVDEAIELISPLTNYGITEKPLWIKGIVTSNSAYNTTYKNYDYAWLQSNDGSEEQAFELYRFKLSGVSGDYTAENSMVGKEVLAYGYGKNYNGTLELATCDNEPKNPLVYEINDPEPTGIELDQDDISLNAGETVTLTATLIPNGAVSTIVWESSDESVATVNNGVVTGVGNGQAIITARTGEYDLETECVVTVTGASLTPNDYLTASTTFAALYGTESSTLTLATDTLVFANAGLSNAANIVDVQIGDVVLNGDRGTNSSNNPKFYTSDNTVRIYSNNTITFEAEGNIEKIEFTYYSDTYASGLAVNLVDIGGNVWEGSSTSVTFKNLSSGQVRIKSVSVTYNKGTYAVNAVSMEFGGKISVDDWNAINDEWSITDYGVMIFRTTEERIDSVSTVEEYYNADPANVTIVRKGSSVAPAPTDNACDFSVKVNFSRTSSFSRIYCAAPFIVAGGNYYFLDEVRYSVNSLASYYLTHSGCDLSTDALTYLSTTN